MSRNSGHIWIVQLSYPPAESFSRKYHIRILSLHMLLAWACVWIKTSWALTPQSKPFLSVFQNSRISNIEDDGGIIFPYIFPNFALFWLAKILRPLKWEVHFLEVGPTLWTSSLFLSQPHVWCRCTNLLTVCMEEAMSECWCQNVNVNVKTLTDIRNVKM